MDNFWQHYWWAVLIVVLAMLIILYILYRIYQIFHIDYHWELNRHFPQWSNEGIITRDSYFLHTEFKFWWLALITGPFWFRILNFYL